MLTAIAIRLSLLSALDTRLVYVTLYPAVAIAAIVGGLPAGLLATLLSAVLAHVLFAPLDHAAAIIGLTAFLISCGIVVGMAELTRTFQQKLTSTMHIRQSSQQLERFVERVPAAIAMFDRNMRYLAASARWRDDFGLDDQVIGRSHYEVLPEISDHWKEIHRRALAGETIRADEDLFTRQDGAQQWLTCEVAPWYDGRGVGGITICSVDLTERKSLEEQLRQSEKLDMIGQLSGGIAHDFNNLLTVIVGNAELLGEQLEKREDLQRLAENIGSAGDRGAELTQQLLAFGRRQLLNPRPFDLNKLIETVNRLLRPTMAEIRVETDLDPDLSPGFADIAQLEAALLNLLLNAQDAMQGKGRLQIKTEARSFDVGESEIAGGDYVMISIIDDGVGMSEQVLAQAFEPFFTTKEFGRSSGLGLSMVYGFAKQSNGHVAIESEVGRGTTVRMYLPRATQIEVPTKQFTPPPQSLAAE